MGTVHGTVPFVWLTLLPGSGAGVVPGRVSLVPLRDLLTMGPLGIVGNLLVVAALGFFAPVRFAALASLPRILALGAGCSVLIETAQYALQLDRVSSVDDVLLNAAGAVLAAAPARPGGRARPAATGPPGPVAAFCLLGRPMDELGDAAVPLDRLGVPALAALPGQLAEDPGWARRFARVDTTLLRLLERRRRGPTPRWRGPGGSCAAAAGRSGSRRSPRARAGAGGTSRSGSAPRSG